MGWRSGLLPSRRELLEHVLSRVEEAHVNRVIYSNDSGMGGGRPWLSRRGIGSDGDDDGDADLDPSAESILGANLAYRAWP